MSVSGRCLSSQCTRMRSENKYSFRISRSTTHATVRTATAISIKITAPVVHSLHCKLKQQQKWPKRCIRLRAISIRSINSIQVYLAPKFSERIWGALVTAWFMSRLNNQILRSFSNYRYQKFHPLSFLRPQDYFFRIVIFLESRRIRKTRRHWI